MTLEILNAVGLVVGIAGGVLAFLRLSAQVGRYSQRVDDHDRRLDKACSGEECKHNEKRIDEAKADIARLSRDMQKMTAEALAFFRDK